MSDEELKQYIEKSPSNSSGQDRQAGKTDPRYAEGSGEASDQIRQELSNVMRDRKILVKIVKILTITIITFGIGFFLLVMTTRGVVIFKTSAGGTSVFRVYKLKIGKISDNVFCLGYKTSNATCLGIGIEMRSEGWDT